ncbi:MAG: PaaI family thioesterase [Candidatus Eremiobacteraeota bacterium]|nr:PaaI family thioesterase [Candidatus Eremiobacteraeota bacterium]MBV8645333.1 PaaI family thioesterase [Candidatus Eremiobacteraeota bacterium]
MQVTRERLVRWEDPHPTAGVLRQSSGLEGLRAIVEGRIPRPPISVLINFAVTEVEEGRVVVEGYPGEEHYNPIGSVHGGFALTLFDTAMSCAIHSLLPAGVAYTTTDVQVRFIRGLNKDTGPVRCEATALHVGRSTAVAEGKLRDGEGRLLGVGTTACAVFRS